MSMSSHLSELRKKHQALSEIIEEEQRKPASDDLNIKQLKLKKLHLKEEIERSAPRRPDAALRSPAAAGPAGRRGDRRRDMPALDDVREPAGSPRPSRRSARGSPGR